jgi:hypothetical protein
MHSARATVMSLMAFVAPLEAQSIVVTTGRPPSPGATLETLLEEAAFRGGLMVVMDEPRGKLRSALGQLVSKDEGLYPYALKMIYLEPNEADTAGSLRRRGGWDASPRWALMDARGGVRATDTQLPRAQDLLRALEEGGFKTYPSQMEAFLREHPGHTAALRNLAWFQQGLAVLRLTPLLERPEATKENPNPEPKLKSPLSAEEDMRIWGDFARLLETYVKTDAWMDAGSLRVKGMGLVEAALSPLMRDTARKLLPRSERVLERYPWSGWDLYLGLSFLAGVENPMPLVDRLAPAPDPVPFPPSDVVQTLADIARQRGDWGAFVRFQLPTWEMYRDTPMQVRGDKESMASVLQNIWNGSGGPLVEAYLRMGDTTKAEKVVSEAVTWSASQQILDLAVEIARRCDQPAVAERWSQLSVTPRPTAPIAASPPAGNSLEALLRNAPYAQTWILVDGTGGKAGPALQEALQDEALVDYALSTRVLTPISHPALAADLVARHGWKDSTGWLLVDKRAQVLAQGAGIPTVRAIKEGVDQAGLQSRVQELETFLKLHSDQAEALQLLLIERLRVATVRMQPFLAPRPEGDKTPDNEDSRELTRPLSPDEDQRIWGPSAALLGRLFNEEAYQLGMVGLASRLSPNARHSPLMQAAANRVLPILEEWIERGHIRYCWDVWVGMQAWTRPPRSVVDLIRRCPPIPGLRPYYPARVIFAFNRDAVARKDWPALLATLEPLWQNVKGYPVFRKEGTPEGDQSIQSTWKQFGPLVEAYLRLQDEGKATVLVQELVDRHGSRTLVRQATALATRCGAVNLALNWNALIPAKGPEPEVMTLGW